jgi:NOL1/NOP2/fmu family ribosome biogenesis protein
MPRFVKAFADYASERAASYYESQLRKDDVLKKHGYMPKEMSESETLKKLNESVIEYQMQEAERKARLELVELNQNYRLSEAIKHFKQNAYGNAKTTNKNNHDS